jgi:16S rRNA (cytosine1402-N4)-methyltransferase
MKANNYHESVLTEEVIRWLDLGRFAHLKRRPRVIDATLATGGHAEAVLEAGGDVLGIDLDSLMVETAEKRLKPFAGRFILTNANFRKIDEIAKENNFETVEGIIFDLGISNVHFKDDSRGFSFEDRSAKLDMRLDPSGQAISAKDLLNALRRDQLVEVFANTLEPNAAREIARRVVVQRSDKPFETVSDFLGVLGGIRERNLHPGTRAFLALRIAVNSELENLKEALPKALGLLGPEGRLIVISFHSGEDAVVKDFFKSTARARVLTPRPVFPGWEEISTNLRSRSARLRVLEKI